MKITREDMKKGLFKTGKYPSRDDVIIELLFEIRESLDALTKGAGGEGEKHE